jgi:hypothetical protein
MTRSLFTLKKIDDFTYDLIVCGIARKRIHREDPSGARHIRNPAGWWCVIERRSGQRVVRDRSLRVIARLAYEFLEPTCKETV